MIRIVTDDILYIEGAQNYTQIHSRAGKYITYLTMGEIEQCLPKERFSRIQQSFMINNGRVRTVEPGQVTLDDNTTLAIGRLYREPFLELMKEVLLQSKRSG